MKIISPSKTNDFTVSRNTCLVGKNEAGKSNVLEAIYKFNPVVPEDKNYNPVYDYPRRKYSEYKERHATNPDNILTLKWKLDETDL